jgi:hypothetical protein
MCCQDAPPAPDLSPAAEASEEVARIQQETARQQLDWAREQDTMNRDLLDQVLDIQLPAMREQFEQAQSDRQRYETDFRPMEDRFREEAESYDTPERRMRERGSAIADVGSQFDAARRNSLQRLESYGIDPSETRSQALDIGVRTQQAVAQAMAATGANRRVEDTGRALRSDAINMGRGALSNAAGFYGQAVGAGGAAQQGALNTTQTGAGALQSSLGFSGQALQGYGQSGNLLSQGYQNQLAGFNAEQQAKAGMMQGIGGMVGLGLGLKDGGEVDGDAVLPVDGGQAIPYSRDGHVATGIGDGSGIDDSVPAMLSDGEFVIPADVVRKKGEEFFEKLIEKYHTPAEKQRAIQ